MWRTLRPSLLLRGLLYAFILLWTSVASATISVIGTPTSNIGGASTTWTGTTPTGATTGDMLVVSIAYSNTATATAPGGWQLIRTDDDATGSAGRLSLWYLRLSAPPSGTYAWTFNIAPASAGGMIALRGVVSAGNPVDVSSTGNQSNTPFYFAPSVITTNANDMLLWANENVGNCGTLTNVSDMTVAFQETCALGTNYGAAMMYLALTATGPTGNKEMDNGANGEHVSDLVALLPEGSATATPTATVTSTATQTPTPTPTPTCVPAGFSCSADGQCCSGVCAGNIICAAFTATPTQTPTTTNTGTVTPTRTHTPIPVVTNTPHFECLTPTHTPTATRTPELGCCNCPDTLLCGNATLLAACPTPCAWTANAACGESNTP